VVEAIGRVIRASVRGAIAWRISRVLLLALGGTACPSAVSPLLFS